MAEQWFDKAGQAVTVTADSKIGIFQGLGGGAMFWDRENKVSLGSAYKTAADSDYWKQRESQAIANSQFVVGASPTTSASFGAALTAAQIAAGQLPLPKPAESVVMTEATANNGNDAIKEKSSVNFDDSSRMAHIALPVYDKNGNLSTWAKGGLPMNDKAETLTPAKNDGAVSVLGTDKLILGAAVAVIGFLLFQASTVSGGKK